ncbi:MAG: 4Fe-4S dicluster domain-containing protein, partial [Chloroflexi bacterium]|nr:4Fe-4S dicluster domain-containing protein [Chloroflexota bacterium]
PYDSCFCTSLGLEPGFSPDVDIMLADAGDAYLVEPVTEQGASLLADLEKAGPDDATRLKDIRQTARRLVSRELETGDISDRVLGVFEDRSFWEKAAAKCLSCGVCTFLCPTCYCFDITDKRSGASGARSRRWDSCAFPEYTRMPAENPREEKWRRVRQRVGHKYVFYPRLFGDIACTGCGRCIRACPVNLDITRLLAGLPARAAVAER